MLTGPSGPSSTGARRPCQWSPSVAALTFDRVFRVAVHRPWRAEFTASPSARLRVAPGGCNANAQASSRSILLRKIAGAIKDKSNSKSHSTYATDLRSVDIDVPGGLLSRQNGHGEVSEEGGQS